MDTQTISLLMQLMQRNDVMQSQGNRKDQDSTFEDMLNQKREDVSNKKDTTSNQTPAKDTQVQEKPEQSETPKVPGQEQDVTNAQQLLAAMMLQQPTPQVIEVQPDVAAVQTPLVQNVAQTVAAQTVAAETTMPGQTTPQAQAAQTANVEMPTLTEVQPQTNATAVPAQSQQQTVTPQVQTATETQQPQTAQETVVTELKAPQEQESGQNKEPVVIANAGEQPLFQDVESVPVKVGDATQTLDTTANVDKQLADTIQAELKTVGDKVQVQLKPEHLGQITIELTQHGDKLGVVIYAENSKTVSLLAQHAGSLGVLMEDRTGQNVNIQVQQQEQQQQPQYDGHNQQQSRQEERQQPQRKEEQDNFMNQLRLGLFQLETV